MSGGYYAVARDLYFRLGDYDDKMETWGAENLEMSFRTWMCGAQIFVVPCSRVSVS